MLIPTKNNTRSITEIREDAVGVLRDASDTGMIYITYYSKPQAVLIDIDEFVAMQERLEDYMDEQEAVRLADTPVGKTYTLEEVMKKYE